MGRKIVICFSGIIAFYLAMFFLITPLMLASREAYILRKNLEFVHSELFLKPMLKLRPENPIRIVWIKNETFWCEIDSKCDVVE